MKNLILTTVAALSFAACSQSQEDKIVDFTRNKMKDPNSFELAQIKMVDTVHKSQLHIASLQPCMDRWKEFNRLADDQMDYVRIYSGSYSSYGQMKWKYYMDNVREYLDSSRKYQNYVDSVQLVITNYKGTDKDSVVGHSWYVSSYANNSFGQRVLGEYNVYVDQKTGQMTFTDNSEHLLKKISGL